MSQDGRAPDPATRTEGETLDLPEGMQGFTQGQVLGERYQILEMLGRGGMGEVWHAFDLKLRVEVALKALRGDLFKSERRLELLRQEVRAAREVVSPNVCRIFDLIEVEGRELVSMEYVDGATLLGVLQERGPLELKEAQDIASQFLAGLEAIHKVGLIHRDIKPENIMLTRAGRVVVMDFGLARQETEGGGTVSGTPAYMAPEQAAGQTLDARADVYASGVVLAEMVSPDGIKSFESRQSLWEGVRSEPAKLPDSPWAPVIQKAVKKDREGRFNSAHTLTRALEDVTLRVEGAEDLHPYPGLSSFTEDDAEYFFGREAEVEQMWRKLEGPTRLLGLVGPSGAGKTSFLQAGLAANAGVGWVCLICKPGNNPQLALSRALAPEMAGDVDAMDLLLRFDDPEVATEVVSRWGRCAAHAVLIVDQFEELFTQNGAVEQRHFSELLSQIVLTSDVHVLLSMRDDFLLRCHDHEALAPLFSDLTPLRAPAGAALRRALVQPATKCGYRFEDDELVDEMLGEVEGERGALPMLAFAAARLWEMRDRETGLLTRHAYEDIGGVGGALARHAEATIDRIGTEHVGIVRELFRNLVTAEGTRAVREWNELLSIFGRDHLREGINPSPTTKGAPVGAGFIPAHEAAEEVLRELIDSRLLTSYEVREEDREPTRRVEIIHESLLANWPRLVRWQTQDADAAQLRDQLRQAAKTWDDQGRSDDTLWTGAAYREFAVWREGYPGGLTEIEEAFATAMTTLATRRRRRRRIAAAAALVLALAVASVFGVLWRRSLLETRRAEATKLLVLAQSHLETDPTEALAFATSSLELADTSEARFLAIRSLWLGPPVQALDLRQFSDATFQLNLFSPDGRWLVASPIVNEEVLVFGEHGGPPIVLGGHAVSAAGYIRCQWTRDGLLVTGHRTENRARVWSMPEGRLRRTIEFEEQAWWQVGYEHLLAEIGQRTDPGEPWPVRLVRWKLPDGEAEELGTFDFRAAGAAQSMFDPRGNAWLYRKGNGVYYRPLPTTTGEPETLIARHSSDGVQLSTWYRGGGLYSTDSNGEIFLWARPEVTSAPGLRLTKPDGSTGRLFSDPSGRWAFDRSDDHRLRLWDREGLEGSDPWVLRRNGGWILSFTDFHPSGAWVVATTRDRSEVSFWPLSWPHPFMARGWMGHAFSPDGKYLVCSDLGSRDGNWANLLRLWPVPGTKDARAVDLELPPDAAADFWGVAIGPAGEMAITSGYGRSVFVIPLNGGEPRRFEGFSATDTVAAVGFSPSGRLAAAATQITQGQPVLRVWDLESDERRVIEQPRDPDGYTGYFAMKLAFVDETTVYTAGANGLLRWDLSTGTYQVMRKPPNGGVLDFSMDSGRRQMLIFERKAASLVRLSSYLFDLESGEFQSLPIPGRGLLSLSPDGTIWTSSEDDGSIWVGRVEGGEPHALLGHEGKTYSFLTSVSPDNRWIASSGFEDKTLRLWPMPDLSKPPLHTLPREELIAKLKTLTNLRVVRDEESSTGWKVEVGPFPRWAEVPEW